MKVVKTVAGVSGINYQALYRWESGYKERGEDAFPGNGNKYIKDDEK